MTAFPSARAVLLDGLSVRAFPAATCEVGRSTGPLWSDAFGHLTYAPNAPVATLQTSFDLASLTKVIASTSLAMSMVRRGVLDLGMPVSNKLALWRGTDRASITVAHLLDHSSGLPAQIRLPTSPHPRETALDAILATPLERPIGSSSVYSDVGFILLGLILEMIDGRSLDVQWNELWNQRPGSSTTAATLAFTPLDAARPHIAPTEVVPERGGLIQGTVHDENAAALGGVAAHAGLFGAAPSVGLFASWILRAFHESTWLATPQLIRTFSARRPVPGSSRALGWDTMLPTSSCGKHMSSTAIGHTGFTGTSLWIDWERDLYVVLLTNRIHPTRENETFLPYRARFHNAVHDDLR